MILTESINFIEQNLCEPITREEIAAHCHVSLSSLEKLFRYALRISIKEYQSKRRMTLAAQDISNGVGTITDIAMKYQYNSPEVFTRAFKSVWNVIPSEFKKNWKFTGIFPKINYLYIEGGEAVMEHRRVDLSDAYDFLKEIKGTYVLCFDGVQFTAFNDVAYKAGDLAILEIASRIDKVATDDMVVMRVGGDEFALVTGLYDEKEVKAIADQVLAENGKPIIYEGMELPLSLRCGMIKIPESLRYFEFYEEMYKSIKKH